MTEEFNLNKKIKMYNTELEQFEDEKGKIINNQAWNLCQSIIKILKFIKKRDKEFILRLNDGEMIKSYELAMKVAGDKKEKLMWKHRKEGWELAIEELNKERGRLNGI